ncbi:MAG: dynamin family protein [Ruminococcus sp.]|nr:dynamin family protein [Ruminococcus sp.]
MPIFEKTAASQQQIDQFLADTERSVAALSEYADYVTVSGLQRICRDFAQNIDDFYRDDRKLNIGIIGQVKAGKSTFLNTLLFGGKEILPTARAPKTAALTKIEYSEENRICVEYYSPEEWQTLESYARTETEDNEHIVARETIKLVAENGIDPMPYLQMRTEEIAFPSLDALMECLNEYVGENGKFTPMVKNVTLYMDKPELAEISIVDTPGMNDAIVSRSERTRDFIGRCDVVFFLSRGSQFIDENDMKMIQNQIPQKGVARMVLICSRFDEALLDELKKCGSLRATIEKLTPKLTEYAQSRFGAAPIFISSLVEAMTGKQESEYSRNEAHVFKRLNRFGDLTQEMMQEIGNLDAVRMLFDEVVASKDETLQQKASGFIPAVKKEWNAAVRDLVAETQRRKLLLETGDKEILQKQKSVMESQITGIKASLETVLGELRIALEQTKGESLRTLRESCRENARLQERTGTEASVHTRKYTTGFWFWKKTHYEDYTTTSTYTYLAATDALENIRTFGYDACTGIETAFRKAVDIKATKRKLMQTILDNFDSSDEDFDINHFRLLAEATLNRIEFPSIKLDVAPFIQTISGQFSGEVRDSGDREKLQKLLSETMDRLFDDVSVQFTKTVSAFRASLDDMQVHFSTELLEGIQLEFDLLCGQVENQERSLSQYEIVLDMLKCAILL